MYNHKYVLISSAKNEEVYIEKTLMSVVSQTVLPVKWIIVSDGSTDRTDQIVAEYQEKNTFINLLQQKSESARNFASKVHCLNTAYEKIKGYDFDFIGVLDADVYFSEDYYEYLMDTMNGNKRLGIVGGNILELHKSTFIRQRISSDSVAGATQFFRRECYEECGGYLPLRLGGEDAIIENTAKMHGWMVQTLYNREVYHCRKVFEARGKILKAIFNQGAMFQTIGYSPLFFTIRAVYRMFDRPVLINSMFQIFGFMYSIFKREELQIPAKIIHFIRLQQRKKILNILLLKRRKQHSV